MILGILLLRSINVTRYCSSCKKHQQASKKLDLWKLPEILVVHLKRFASLDGVRREKKEDMIEFPTKGLDLTKYGIGMKDKSCIYDLFGVVVTTHTVFTLKPSESYGGTKWRPLHRTL